MQQEPDADIDQLLVEHRVVICLHDNIGGSLQRERKPFNTLLARLTDKSKSKGKSAVLKQLAVQDAGRSIKDNLTTRMHVSKFRKAAKTFKNGLNNLDIYLNGIEECTPGWVKAPKWSLIRQIKTYLMSRTKADHTVIGRQGCLSAWILMALGSAHSPPHKDEIGLDTYLHFVQGRCVVSFCLIKDPDDVKT